MDEFPPHDSEDSLEPEHVADELRGLAAELPREGATAPGVFRENDGPYAPRRSGRHRGRTVSPDPLMFHTTIWMEHDHEASARMKNP